MVSYIFIYPHYITDPSGFTPACWGISLQVGKDWMTGCTQETENTLNLWSVDDWKGLFYPISWYILGIVTVKLLACSFPATSFCLT